MKQIKQLHRVILCQFHRMMVEIISRARILRDAAMLLPQDERNYFRTDSSSKLSARPEAAQRASRRIRAHTGGYHMELVLSCVCIILLTVVCGPSLAAVNGISSTNNTAALYYSTGTTPTPVSGDTFSGYVSFDTGLTIPQGANITLDTVGVFGGVLDFSNVNSRLTLAQDLQCRSDFSITNTVGGYITGNSHTIKLAGDLTVSHPLTTSFSTLTIDGQGHRLTLNCAGALTSTSTINFQNMDLVLATASAINSGGGTIISLQNVNVFMTGDQGTNNLHITGHVAMYGPGSSFRCNNAYTINDDSILYVCQGVTLGFQTTGAVNFGGPGATLALDGCTLDAVSWSPINVIMTGGMVTFSNQVLIKVTGQSLTIGNGLGGGETRIVVNSGANVLVDGTLYHNPS